MAIFEERTKMRKKISQFYEILHTLLCTSDIRLQVNVIITHYNKNLTILNLQYPVLKY